MNRIAQPGFQAFVSALIFSIFVSACGPDKLPSTTPDTISSSGGKSILPLVNFPTPAVYQTKMIDGTEMKLGRFPAGQFGGTLVRSMVGVDPKTFNYWAAEDTNSGTLCGLMFSGLVSVDPYSGNVIPDMAESFTVDPDGVTYTTKLRKGLKWSDGKPITSQDVAYTWNTIIAGGYGNSSLRDVCTIEGKMPKVTVIDQLTNKYITAKPFAPFLRQIGVAIAPKHIIEPIIKGKDGHKAFQEFWSSNIDPKTLVTNGPYTLTRFVPSQRVEMQATKNYYMANQDGKRLPYLAKMIFLIVPDPNTNELKFRGKEIDLTPIRARVVSEFLPHQDSENFKLYNMGPSIGTTFIMVNMNRRKSPKTGKPYVDPIKSVWFNDTNFRQALNHSINREQMVANYLKGIGSPLFTAEPSASPYHNTSLQPIKPDDVYAMSLLEKSGFKKKPDGVLYDKDGNKVEFTLLTSSGSTFYESIGTMMIEDFKKLGMKVNFQQVNFNLLNDKLSNSLDWEACLMSLSPSDALEPNDGANTYKSSGRLHMFDQRLPDDSGTVVVTDARPWEKRLDDIFTEGAETLDKAKRHQVYDEYQKIVYDEAPFIFLVTPVTIVGARNTIQNFQPVPLSENLFGIHNPEELWKKQ